MQVRRNEMIGNKGVEMELSGLKYQHGLLSFGHVLNHPVDDLGAIASQVFGFGNHVAELFLKLLSFLLAALLHTAFPSIIGFRLFGSIVGIHPRFAALLDPIYRLFQLFLVLPFRQLVFAFRRLLQLLGLGL
jgi:hypothetical protein